jgi:hypothetical protein
VRPAACLAAHPPVTARPTSYSSAPTNRPLKRRCRGEKSCGRTKYWTLWRAASRPVVKLS